LPRHRIQGTEVIREIVFKKNPAPRGFRAGYEPAFGAAAQFLGMHVKEGGGLFQIQGIHGVLNPE
jgi:hypothetical protein